MTRRKNNNKKTISLTFRRSISDFKGLKVEKSVSDVRLGWLVPSGFSLAVREEVGYTRPRTRTETRTRGVMGSRHGRSWLKTSQSTLRNYARNY